MVAKPVEGALGQCKISPST